MFNDRLVAAGSYIRVSGRSIGGTSRPQSLNTPLLQLAGWGLTETGRQSSVLKWAFQKFIEFKTCLSLIPPRDKKYLTHDKFCVEEVKG